MDRGRMRRMAVAAGFVGVPAIALNQTTVRGKTISLLQISFFAVLITSILLRSLASVKAVLR